MGEKPLSSVKVIDCASLFAGPLAATMLADFGAEVIKVEHPEGDKTRFWGTDKKNVNWLWMGRNKKSVPIDLHEPEGQALLIELAKDADVLVENFRPGRLEQWGVGWETLSEANPDLVMARATGFGQTGPYKHKAGFGTLAEAMSGFAYSTGQPDGPPTLPPFALADGISALFTTFAIMFALYWRDVEGGTGQYIDTSILEPIFALLGDHVLQYSVHDEIIDRRGNRQPGNPGRNTYKTKDDRWVALSPGGAAVIDRVLEIVGGEELVDDPRFQTVEDRSNHIDELEAAIQGWMAEHTREEVIEVFDEFEAAVAPVYNMADIFEDPHFAARDALVEVADEDFGDVEMVGVFPKLSETPGEVSHAGPALGEHAVSVLTEELALDRGELRDLYERGVINVADPADLEDPA